MASFKLRINEKNLKIAQFMEVAGKAVKVLQENGDILVKFRYGLNISRLEVGSIIKGFTDGDWRAFVEEIKSTLKGAKIREASDMVVRLRSLRTEDIHIRLDPLERETIEEAARLEGKSLSDFIRAAALRRAGETFDEEKAKKMAKQKREESPYIQ